LNGNVDPDADQPRCPSSVVPIPAAPNQHPASLFRKAEVANFYLEGDLILLTPVKRLFHGTPIVGVNLFRFS